MRKTAVKHTFAPDGYRKIGFSVPKTSLKLTALF